MNMKLLIAFCFYVTFILATPIVTDTTRNVTYIGTSANGVEQFQNVFFGQDTSGQNRFAPPKLYTPPHNTIINATAPGAACPQPEVPVPGVPVFSNVTLISEDCLSLRIARPTNTSAKQKLPVMIWIFGGGDEIGQIYDQIYDPTGLVLQAAGQKQPIIYAAVNYRVNIFGFPASDALKKTKSLNAGLRDQRLGIQWIKDNIAAFGGDPENLTIFGESDGANAVGLQMTAYGGTQGGLFQRAIMESGSPISDPGSSDDISGAHFASVVTQVNCTTPQGPNSEEALECLRKVPMETLMTIATSTGGALSGTNTFCPLVDGDFIPEAPSTLVHSGRFSKDVDVIIGWNANDGSLFTPTTIINDTGVVDFLHTDFPKLTNATLIKFLDLYPVSDFTFQVQPQFNITAQYYRAQRMWRDITFTCTSIDFGFNIMKYSHAQARLFELNQTMFTSFFTAANESYLGISHFSDILYVFNEAEAFNASASDTQISSEISGMWAAFATTSTPSKSWPLAYADEDCVKDSFPEKATINVLGGPYAGPAQVTSKSGKADGPVGMEELLQRCSFVHSIYNELHT